LGHDKVCDDCENRNTCLGGTSPGEILLAGPDIDTIEQNDVPAVRSAVLRLMREHGVIPVLLAMGPIVSHLLRGAQIFVSAGMMEDSMSRSLWKPVLVDVVAVIFAMRKLVRQGVADGHLPNPSDCPPRPNRDEN